jgi:hypothetical protein
MKFAYEQRSSSRAPRSELCNSLAMNAQIKLLARIFTLSAVLSAPSLASAYYDPGAQRWINRDPLGEHGGRNLYRYVYNSPIDDVDAHGLFGREDHGHDYMKEDNCWYKSSIPPWSYWRHFRKDMDKIEKELESAVSICDLKRFRSRVHMGQDNIGHRKYLNRPWPVGHWIETIFCPSKCPDKRPTKEAQKAASDFRTKWEQAWNDAGCKPALPEKKSPPESGDSTPFESGAILWR